MRNYFDKRQVPGYWIDAPVSADTDMSVVIPAMAEPALDQTINSLFACDRPAGVVEIIVVLNHPEGALLDVRYMNDQSRKILESLQQNAPEWARIHLLDACDLPSKHAGVGLARKLGMDEAARRIFAIDKSGAIPVVCLDADCLVHPRYMRTIAEFFRGRPGAEGCSIGFAHRMDGLDKWELEAIARYELHLRYFVQAQRWARFPFAFQTIGSCMAVRAGTYAATGGMNTRKAGEDFYFLHKVIERGRFQDLASVLVFPSGRRSDRVPFGTGKAVSRIIDGEAFRTYAPRTFDELRHFVSIVPLLCKGEIGDVLEQVGPAIRDYLYSRDIEAKVAEVRSNTASRQTFVRRFFSWFNAFRLMKFVHFARDNHYPDVEVFDAAAWLLGEYGVSEVSDEFGALEQLRALALKGYEVHYPA